MIKNLSNSTSTSFRSSSTILLMTTIFCLFQNSSQYNVLPALVLKDSNGQLADKTECEKLAIESKFQEALTVCQKSSQSSVDAQVLEAYSRYMLGEKEIAYKMLFQVYQKNPLNLYLILTYGEIFQQQGYLTEPRQLFNFAVQKYPDSVLAIEINRENRFDQNNDEEQILIESAQLNKEDSNYLIQACKMNFKLKNNLLTMQTCFEAFEKNQQNFEVAFALSVTSFRLEDEKNFEKYVLQAAKLNKTDPAALNNLGVHYYLKGNNDYAISAFRQAIQQDQYFFRTYYNLAIAFIDQKNYQNAISSLKRYNSLFPYDSNGYYLLGYSYQQLNQLDNALKEYDFAYEVQPSNVNILFNKAQILKLQNKLEESKKTLQEAVSKSDREDYDLYYNGDVIKISLGYKGQYKCYSQSFDFNPQLRQDYDEISDLLFENKRYPEALECYDVLLRNFENSNSLYYKKIGDIYLQNGRLEVAEKIFTDGLKLYNNDVQLLLGKAAILQSQQKNQEAEELYNQILQKESRNFKALNNLGYMQLTKQDYSKAKQYFEQALQVEPEDTIVLLNLSKVELAQNNLERVRQYAEQIINLDPLNASAYYMLSQYYSSLQQPDNERAIQLINRAIYLDNSMPDFYLQKANLFDRLGLVIEALPSYENLSKLTPNNVYVLMKLGAIYDALETPEQSAAIYESVVRLEPENYSAFYLGGVAFLKLGDFQTSLAFVQRATELKPDFAEAYIVLGDIYAINKDYQKAKQYFETAQKLQQQNEEIKEKLKQLDTLISAQTQTN